MIHIIKFFLLFLPLRVHNTYWGEFTKFIIVFKVVFPNVWYFGISIECGFRIIIIIIILPSHVHKKKLSFTWLKFKFQNVMFFKHLATFVMWSLFVCQFFCAVLMWGLVQDRKSLCCRQRNILYGLANMHSFWRISCIWVT